jgi:hypothetical protein
VLRSIHYNMSRSTSDMRQPVNLSSSNVGSKIFLVHTSHHTRPFFVVVPFMARDFVEWGFRVEHHISDSAYITEVRHREFQAYLNGLTCKTRHETRRKKLLEIWGQEIVRRKLQGRERGSETDTAVPAVTWGFGNQDKRLQKVGSFVQDFIGQLTAFNQCGCEIPKHLIKLDPNHKYGDDIPPVPLRITSKYMRLLDNIKHASNVPVPDWAHPNIHYADRVTLEFYHHAAVKLSHLAHAMERALAKGEGRMGRTEKDKVTGVNRVLLWVDVGDCLIMQGSWDDETMDPVPLYERGEHPPVYVEVCG